MISTLDPSALEQHPFFEKLDPGTLEAMLPFLELTSCEGGKILFRQGDRGDCLFLVLSGRLRILMERNGEITNIAEAGYGEVVGEIALLTEEPRGATAQAIRDTILLRLTRENYYKMVDQKPRLMLGFVRTVVQRVQATRQMDRRTRPMSTVAVLALSESVDLTDFCNKLKAAFVELDTCFLIDLNEWNRRQADEGMCALDNNEPVSWLNELERDFKFVIFETQSQNAAWTRRCLRHADIVLMVGDTKLAPNTNPHFQAYIKGRHHNETVRSELVLLHDSSQTLRKGSSQWVRILKPNALHHLVPTRKSDFSHLARMLAGRANGIVLGGGGARGFAHIGVLRALREAGVAIDLVGGTSMGAIIGGLYALEWDVAKISRRLQKEFLQSGRLWDFTLPLLALTQGLVFRRMGQRLLPSIDMEIEDLWLPFFCIASNLTRGQAVIGKSGPLWPWVRASAAVPGLVPPLLMNHEILVDGGLVNNVPADVMRALGRGPVIAVDVSPPEEATLLMDDIDDFSPWLYLLQRFNPFNNKPTPRVPSLSDILIRSATISAVSEIGKLERNSDLIIHPPVDNIGLLEWRAKERAEKIGYRHTLEVLERRDKLNLKLGQ